MISRPLASLFVGVALLAATAVAQIAPVAKTGEGPPGQKDPGTIGVVSGQVPAQHGQAMLAPVDHKDANASYESTKGWWAPGEGDVLPQNVEFADSTGRLGVLNASGAQPTAGHPFFAALGTNGRACVSCHQPADSMSLSTKTLQQRWKDTDGKDPVFAPVDGSNCPNLPQGDPKSHSLLLQKGLFRVFLPWPPRAADGSRITPEFDIAVVNDPTGCNTDKVYGLKSANPMVSVYRRPRMAANLKYVASPFSIAGRFDGKRGLPLAINPDNGLRVGLPIMADARHATLKAQAADAVLNHMQAKALPSPAQLQQIVDFESQIYSAQVVNNVGGSLIAPGGPDSLGPKILADNKQVTQGFNWRNPVFGSFDGWREATPGESPKEAAFRASAARGYDIFFQRPFWIRDVAWFNSIGMGNPYKRTCAICHSVQLSGSDISPGVMDIGISNVPWAQDRPDLPLFKITCKPSAAPHFFLGRTILTHDPGRALITGRCNDVGSVVMQQMRGLAARAPYFSNGTAKDLRGVVDYYETRFKIGLTEQDKVDLTNFLSVL